MREIPLPKKQDTKQTTRPTYKSDTHQWLSNQTHPEAHTVPGVSNQGHPADLSESASHAAAVLWLHKPWRQRRRQYPEQEPQNKENQANLTPKTPRPSTKTLTTSETPSTSLSDEPLEALEDLGDLLELEGPEDLEGLEIHTDQDHTQYHQHSSSPSTQPETSNQLGFLP